MAFTKVVGAGIHTLSNITSHNINSSGIITATKFVGPFDGTSGTFSGNVTIGGNLSVAQTVTYEDVKNVDSVGVITARSGIKDQTLTAGRVVYVDSDKTLTDSANLTFNGNDVGIARSIYHLNDIDTSIGFPQNGTVRITGNNETVADFTGSYGGGGQISLNKQVFATGGTDGSRFSNASIAPNIFKYCSLFSLNVFSRSINCVSSISFFSVNSSNILSGSIMVK